MGDVMIDHAAEKRRLALVSRNWRLLYWHPESCPCDLCLQQQAEVESALDAYAALVGQETANDLEQVRVQLAGCLVAAEGGTNDPAKQGDYGWSLAYQRTLDLRRAHDAQDAEIARLRKVLEAALTE